MKAKFNILILLHQLPVSALVLNFRSLSRFEGALAPWPLFYLRKKSPFN